MTEPFDPLFHGGVPVYIETPLTRVLIGEVYHTTDDNYCYIVYATDDIDEDFESRNEATAACMEAYVEIMVRKVDKIKELVAELNDNFNRSFKLTDMDYFNG